MHLQENRNIINIKTKEKGKQKRMIGINQREEQILRYLVTSRDPSVSAIAELLQVSAVTVRNMLSNLEEKGYVVRTHGGAIPAYHPDLMERRLSNIELKEKLAQEASTHIQPGDKMMVVNGTTSAMVGKFLFGKGDLQVVTNSLLMLPYARMNPSLKLTVVGGEFSPSAEALTGPSAMEDLDKYHVDITITGTDGFSLEDGLTTQLPGNAEIVRKMIQRASRNILVAESSKYKRQGFVKILPMTDIDILITDTNFPETDAKEFESFGITVIRVAP